jgi:periplasmic divalent cation tolerance protein
MTSSVNAVVVTTVVGSRTAADDIARELVTRRLAACVQVSGPLASTYRWDNKINVDEEWRVDCKTTQPAADALVAAIVQLHSYDVPEVLVVPVLAGHPAYLSWMAGEVAADIGADS